MKLSYLLKASNIRNKEEYNWGEKFSPGIKTPLFD